MCFPELTSLLVDSSPGIGSQCSEEEGSCSGRGLYGIHAADGVGES